MNIHELIKIWENEKKNKKLEFWDFSEDNYLKFVFANNIYKVLEKDDYIQSIKLLIQIRQYIDNIYFKLFNNFNDYSDQQKKGIICFLETPYLLSEMKENTIFNGLNKPRLVYNTKNEKDSYKLGKDEYLRAKYRDIFLTLRYKNGKLKNIKQLKELILHELAHTFCNHVKWRDDDHGNDFKMYLKILHNLDKDESI